jgi:hypothetical protein
MKMSMPSRSHTIRFPAELYDKIHMLADQNGRTFNGSGGLSITDRVRGGT